MEAQTIKAGGMFILSVNISGVPVPNVKWYLKDREVSSSGNVTIDTSDTHSTLQVKGSTSKNAGTYRVTAENEVGSDSVELTVTITGMCNKLNTFIVLLFTSKVFKFILYY